MSDSNHPPHIPPEWHLQRVAEAVAELWAGNRVEAMTLAMMAGVDAAMLGLPVVAVPHEIAARPDLLQEYRWGFKIAEAGRIKQEQGVLI
jgi:hypothetical protein